MLSWFIWQSHILGEPHILKRLVGISSKFKLGMQFEEAESKDGIRMSWNIWPSFVNLLNAVNLLRDEGRRHVDGGSDRVFVLPA